MVGLAGTHERSFPANSPRQMPPAESTGPRNGPPGIASGPLRYSCGVAAEGVKGMPQIVLSVPWTWNFGDPPKGGQCTFSVLPRSPDWGVSRFKAGLLLARDCLRLARQAAGSKAVIISTIGAEAGLIAALTRLRSRSTRIVVFDFLAPRAEFPNWLTRRVFRFVDHFLVIRSGDAAMLERRFGIPANRCSFLPWPVRTDQIPVEVADEGYLYSAGWAHRDWPTLLKALEETRTHAKIAPGSAVEIPAGCQGRVEVLTMPSPEEGRRLMAKASVVAVVLRDTDLPSGPLVLLDAMAAGKAVVATDVNGTRDYVRDGDTALVVPPGDPKALADAIALLGNDPQLRTRLGRAAHEATLQQCSIDHFWTGLAGECCGS